MHYTLRAVLVAASAACALPAFAQEQTTTLGGYGNAVLRSTTSHIMAGGKDSAGATDTRANIDRFVLFVSHAFNDRISFRSEIEWEDTKLQAGGASGETSIEQMYLDFAVSKGFNPRAGLLLVPVGIINEFHEPPTFNGNDRPALEVEDGGIIPSTWRELGAGAFGEISPGWNYRAYLMAGMLASEFSHEGGIGEGKQEGALANAKNLAVTGRIEYTGTTGLRAGASFYFSGTSGGDTAKFGADGSGIFAIPMSVFSVDAQYTVADLFLRAVWATTALDADKINKAFHTDSTGMLMDPVAKGMGGFYVEAAYNVMKLMDDKSSAQVLPFVRYESINLNASLASGATQDDALLKTVIVAGLTYKPVYNIAFKADWQSMSNKAFADKVNGAGAGSRLSLGLGYMF